MPLAKSQLATYANQYKTTPRQLPGDTCKTSWVTRGANFVVVVSKVEDGDLLTRDNIDEYVLLLPETSGVSATLEAPGEKVEAGVDTLNILPPGKTTIRLKGSGLVSRVFSSDVKDLAALADNAATYDTPNPDVAPLVAWPDPPEGFKIRSYNLPEYTKPDSNMRIFRTTKLMVNPLVKRVVPRDVRKVSPHSHVDFEQGSLALNGAYMHHLRYPWTPDMTMWHDDEHEELGSPSLLVVPPKVIHTSRNVGEEVGVLVDIFAPPRMDFSKKGVVCNASEYPMPEEATTTA